MAETKWYGKYRAIVQDVNDPERRGRIRVQCPKVLGNYLSAWCEPCIPYATDFAGDYYVPPVGEAIWIEFEEGDVDKPIWNGGWYRPDSTPLTATAKPEDYRYIIFKNSVIRMGEMDFTFELRDIEAGSSHIVSIDDTTWMGLNYIGSKTETELQDLETIVVNKTYLLETFPAEVQENFGEVRQDIQDVADNFKAFLKDNYNPFVLVTYPRDMEALQSALDRVSDQLASINRDLQILRDGINAIDDRLGREVDNLQNQINDRIDSRTFIKTYYHLRDKLNGMIAVGAINKEGEVVNPWIYWLGENPIVNTDGSSTYGYWDGTRFAGGIQYNV